MAETMSVTAILSAYDKGFTSGMKNAAKATESLSSKVKSGLGFGVMTGVGMAAFNSLTNGARSLITEIDSSNASWKTFSGNMQILGKGTGEINKVKSELQSFAEQTIYSSSDMASTYAQLEAVGTKSTLGLVKGFGGLAAAAENPQQAMKTLSQQATQMAAKPTVAWQDFKLMLEQTPAGMAAVAKEMGMTSAELVSKIQAGEVATEDFFAAIEKVGTSKGFENLATQYKTVDQAMDGLKETLGNKLGPAYEAVSQRAISSISKIIDQVGKIDGNALAAKVTAGLDAAKPYWDVFVSVVKVAGKALKATAGFLADHASTISKVLPYVLGLAAAFKGFKILNAIIPGFSSFTSMLGKLGGKGISAIAGKLFGISAGQKEVGKSSSVSAKKMLASAKAMALMGIAVLLVAAGFALLAYSSIQLANAGGAAIGVMVGMVAAVAGIGIGMMMLLKTLAPMSGKLVAVGVAFLALGSAVLLISVGFALMANAAISLAAAGWPAIAVMVGMVAVIALLAVGAALLGTALTAGAVGFIAFGAAILLCGVGALLAAAALNIVAGVLPTIAAYGLQGAGAIALLGAGMIVFAVGAALAGAACIILGAGLLVVAVGLLLAGAAVMVLAAGMLIIGVSAMLAAAGLAIVAAVLPIIASYGLQGALAIAALGAALIVFGAGAIVAGAATLVLGAGLLVVSAAVLILSAGVLMLAAGMLLLAAGLTVASTSMMMLAVSMPLAAVGALLLVTAFAMLLALSIGVGAAVLLISAGLVALGIAAMASAIGVGAFGAAMVLAAAGTVTMAAALTAVNSKMKSISKNARSTASSLKNMKSSISVVESGLDALGSKASSAMNKLISAFNNAASQAQSAGQRLGTGFTQGMQSGLAAAPAVAMMAVAAVGAALRSGYGTAYSAGAYISQGFARGMESCLGRIIAAANKMVQAANKAVEAKAKIGSPSRLFAKLGKFLGMGFENGILSTAKDVWAAAEQLVSIPNVAAPDVAMAYSGELSSDYDYTRRTEYTIDVPLTVDGKEFARATATYTQDELDKRQTRNRRKQGKLGVAYV